MNYNQNKFRKWISVSEAMPKPYQLVRVMGTFECDKMLYLDDDENGWEQKKHGDIEITHWKPAKKKV